MKQPKVSVAKLRKLKNDYLKNETAGEMEARRQLKKKEKEAEKKVINESEELFNPALKDAIENMEVAAKKGLNSTVVFRASSQDFFRKKVYDLVAIRLEKYFQLKRFTTYRSCGYSDCCLEVGGW